MKIAEGISRNIDGEVNKTVLKIKKELSFIYIKNRQFTEALEECKQLEYLEAQIHGTESV